MEIFGLKISWLGHACFKIESKVTIYLDPFQIKFPKERDGDIVLITHDHFDHCSLDDIKKIIHPQSVIISAKMCRGKIENLKGSVNKIVYFEPGDSLNVNNVVIKAVESYNVNKFRLPGQVFHPKELKYVGYILDINGVRVYHSGDTDVIPEMNTFGKIDIAFLPVSGVYVMTADEAVEAVKILKPKVCIPMHYGSIVGSEKDVERFKNAASQFTKVEVLKKE
ncbi:MAG: MBL fold metallo-hydrolase [Candidatus Aenigmarchaeota archaeon]|nr:MBL fold metallo-hydrolase [Candidatus Aenigmarchaeota archaeon]MCX8191098.1 MBL fold metallo-hydrolase [Candidatus Aenigmarchaeota archaeon]MDW8160188.1 MBL fold metallo-hydrolase [Candidatus Aenigmarchaeota archaeon]